MTSKYHMFQDKRSLIPDEQRRALVRTFKNFIDEYYHGDKNIWNRRGEPYIFYKHLFRKFAIEQLEILERVRDLEGLVTGVRPDKTTIYNSRDIDPSTFTLKKEEITEIIKFLNRHYNINVQQRIKTVIMKKLNDGYTKDDVARHCLVHETVVHNILNNKKVPNNILRQIEQELINE